ncbi:MAG: SusC/RagA family TonB-linked outer membrane protein [Agriterribacter sp.]
MCQECYLRRILPALFLLFSIPFYALAQQKVSGKIISAKDQSPLAGISVTVKSTSKGTTTDADGLFSIEAKNGDVLVITGVGYTAQQVRVDGSAISVELAEDNRSLSEVVVTALGVKKEIKKLGYSIEEVKGQDLVKARDQNPITGLTGKVAGLSVGPSAEMLRKPTVFLRGNEITLYVVDGIPVSSDTWNISPDDIESYTILKGPTAAALYGSRAQFGAILITTKKGSKAKARGFTVEFNSSNVIDKGFLAFPRIQDQYGPGENGIYAFGNGKGGGINDGDYDVWGPKFEGQLIPQYDGKYDPNTTYETKFGDYIYSGNIEPTPYVARGKNNLKRFLRTGFQTTNNIALSASGENYNMRFSLSHSYQQGMIPNTSLNITNFNIYGSYKPTQKLKIEANFNYNRQYTPNIPDVDYGPNSLIYNIAIWTGADWDVDDPAIKAVWQPGKTNVQSLFAEYQRYHNPWLVVNYWLRGHYKTDLYGYISGNYEFNKNLNLNARTQITGYDLLRTEKMPYSAHPYGREENKGDYREDRRSLFENNTDVQLNYNYLIKDFLGISGFVGASARNFTYNSSFTTTDYLSIPAVYSFSNSLNPIQANSFYSDMRVLSAYYSVDVSLGKFLTLSTTGRTDKSSAAPRGLSYFYPSISMASVISDYVKLPGVISFLKLRASYAAVRGDATSADIGIADFDPLGYGQNYYSPYGGPNYSLLSVLSTSKPYNNQTAAYTSGSVFDPNLKPFNRVNYEGGFDIKFLNNRLGLGATYFQYIDGPQILTNPISSATGYDYYVLNALKTRKTGYEFALSGSPIRTKNRFSWDVLLTWSTFQDRYLELPPGQSIFNTFFKKGDRVDKFYTSAFVKTTDGKVVYDESGYPLSNPVSQFLGYLNADYSWSVYNRVSWKNLSVGFQFDGRVGGVTTDYMHNKTMRGGRNQETVEGKLGEARKNDADHAGENDYEGIYVGDGVVVSNNTPINFDSETGAILNYKDLQFAANTTPLQVQPWVSAFYNVSEANLMSKTYAKLREVTISYQFPDKWLAKSFISKASVSLVGRNLIYFYKDKRFRDVDLDQYNDKTTGTALQSPTNRRYGFNLNIVF